MHAGYGGSAHYQQDEELVPHREVNDAVDHGFATAFMRLSESTRKVPEITMRSPAWSPFVTWTSSPIRHPVSTSRGSKHPLPQSTKTVLCSPVSTMASAGTTIVGGRFTGNSTSTNIPGLSASFGFAASSRTFRVSVASSKIGSDRLTVAASARLPSA